MRHPIGGGPALLARGAFAAAGLLTVAAGALAVRGPASGRMLADAGAAVAFLAVPAVGFVIVRRDVRNATGWALLAAGFGLSLRTFALIYGELALEHHRGLPAVAHVIWFDPLGGSFYTAGVTLTVLLLPDGRFPRGRWRWAARAALVCLIPGVGSWFAADFWHFDNISNPYALPGVGGQIGDAGVLLGVLLLPVVDTLAALVMTARLRATTAPRLRAALRLTTAGAWTITTAQWTCWFFGDTSWLHSIYLFEHSAVLVLGIGAWIGIVRYRLFDIRFAVNRALLYGTLTGVVLLIYGTVFFVVRALAGGPAPAVVGVAVAALVALPLRDGLQRLANRIVYGQRQDPYAAFRTLNEQLGAAAAPGEALPRVVTMLAQQLRLRYAAVTSGDQVLAAAGDMDQEADGQPIGVDLTFEGDVVGKLTARTAGPEDRLSPAEMNLLKGLAPQLAAAVRAVVLAEALRRSHERIIALREEERRRIRRDLHDGLGPTLAGLVLGIDRARAQLDRDVTAAAHTLDTLGEQAAAAVTDVRRLVHDLRPPTLDELGLAGALREEGRRLGVAVIDADDVPPLPAAVEVAVYRIALEALTNANRHARAAAVSLHLRLEEETVELEVADDGPGIDPGHPIGIGLASMRERAGELGGRCVIAPRQPTGTMVRATLPLRIPQTRAERVEAELG